MSILIYLATNVSHSSVIFYSFNALLAGSRICAHEPVIWPHGTFIPAAPAPHPAFGRFLSGSAGHQGEGTGRRSVYSNVTFRHFIRFQAILALDGGFGSAAGRSSCPGYYPFQAGGLTQNYPRNTTKIFARKKSHTRIITDESTTACLAAAPTPSAPPLVLSPT